jgi:hypothetical protein
MIILLIHGIGAVCMLLLYLTTSFAHHVPEPPAEMVRFTGRGGLYRELPEEMSPPQTEDPERRVCAQAVIHVGVPALSVLYFSMLYLDRYGACLRIGAWLLILLVAYRTSHQTAWCRKADAGKHSENKTRRSS